MCIVWIHSLMVLWLFYHWDFNAERRRCLRMDIRCHKKQSEKLNIRNYVEKVSELILKGKLRLCQLTGIDPAEFVVPFTNAELSSLWTENELCQTTCSHFFGERLTTNIPKVRAFSL